MLSIVVERIIQFVHKSGQSSTDSLMRAVHTQSGSGLDYKTQQLRLNTIPGSSVARLRFENAGGPEVLAVTIADRDLGDVRDRGDRTL